MYIYLTCEISFIMEELKVLKIGIFFDTNLLISMLFEDFRRKMYKDSDIDRRN